MFSTATMESSTSSPSATTKPAIDSWLSEKPRKYSTAMPNASDSGIEIMTMPAARRPSGSRVSSTTATAMPKSMYSRSRRLATLRDWSKPSSSEMRLGRPSAQRSTLATTASRTSSTL